MLVYCTIHLPEQLLPYDAWPRTALEREGPKMAKRSAALKLAPWIQEPTSMALALSEVGDYGAAVFVADHDSSLILSALLRLCGFARLHSVAQQWHTYVAQVANRLPLLTFGQLPSLGRFDGAAGNKSDT
jgi:hypothetical protein